MKEKKNIINGKERKYYGNGTIISIKVPNSRGEIGVLEFRDRRGFEPIFYMESPYSRYITTLTKEQVIEKLLAQKWFTEAEFFAPKIDEEIREDGRIELTTYVNLKPFDISILLENIGKLTLIKECQRAIKNYPITLSFWKDFTKRLEEVEEEKKAKSSN